MAGVGITKETDLYRLRVLLTEKSNDHKPNWHQSTRLKQRNSVRRRNISRDLFLKIGLCKCGSWQGKTEVHSAGSQKGQFGILEQQLKVQFTGAISSASGELHPFGRSPN